MGRKKKIKTPQEMEAFLRETCAFVSEAVNEVMRRPEFAGTIEIIGRDRSDDDASGSRLGRRSIATVEPETPSQMLIKS